MTAGMQLPRRSRGSCAPPSRLRCCLLVARGARRAITDKLNSWFFGGGSSTQQPPGNTPAQHGGRDRLSRRRRCARARPRSRSLRRAPRPAPMTTRYQVTIGADGARMRGARRRDDHEGRRAGPRAARAGRRAGRRSMCRCAWRWCRRGRTRRPIVSKFCTAVGRDSDPDRPRVPFVHVEQDLTFPMPRGSLIEAYVVYVGFDPARRQSPSASRSSRRRKNNGSAEHHPRLGLTQACVFCGPMSSSGALFSYDHVTCNM